MKIAHFPLKWQSQYTIETMAGVYLVCVSYLKNHNSLSWNSSAYKQQTINAISNVILRLYYQWQSYTNLSRMYTLVLISQSPTNITISNGICAVKIYIRCAALHHLCHRIMYLIMQGNVRYFHNIFAALKSHYCFRTTGLVCFIHSIYSLKVF